MRLPFQLILPFLLICLWATAQNPHPYFRNYTTDDDLPSPEVHYCLQDTAGYMWFATDNGVSRFDGYEFKNYGLQEGLKHPVVFYMQQAPDGKIWLGTMNGHLYFIEKDSIHAFAQNDIIEKENKGQHTLIDFYIDSLGNKYLSIIKSCILKFSLDLSYKKICPQNKDIHQIGIQIQDRWIVGVMETSDYFRKKYSDNNSQGKNLIYPMEFHTDSIYYLDTILSTKGNNASSFFLKTFRNNEIIGFRNKFFFNLKKSKIHWRFKSDINMNRKAILEKEDGSLLLGLVNGKGIRKYKNINTIPTQQFEQYLEGISVSDIYQDRDGAYWISSIEHGIFYCPSFDLKIYDRSAGFPIDYVSAFDFKNEKEMYIGFRNGEVHTLNLSDNSLNSFPKPKGSIIYDIFYDNKRDELWATTGVMNLFYDKKNIWKQIRQTPSIADRNNIIAKKMTQGKNRSTLWGTTFSGFGALDLDTKIQTYISWNHGIQARTFRVWEDQLHRIWIGNVDGLFELKDNQLISPQPNFPEFQTRVEDLSELSDGTLVIASKGEGVLLWKDDFFHQLTTANGLTSNMLENVFVDEQDQIWAGTLSGLNKIVQQDDDFFIEKYTKLHGLPSNEITQVKSIAGKIWVATTKGLIEWKEKERSFFSKKPLLEKMLVNNLPFDFSVKNKLSYTEDNLEFQFSTINYNQDGKIPYRFRLNNNDWNITQNRSVNFAQLTFGKYQFEVQSQNEDGMWSESSVANFEIRPPIWRTWGFIFLSVIALLGAGISFYRNRLNRIRQEAQTEKEINELQRSALRAQMNPHFIFNCLNSIQNFILQNDQTNATKYLGQFAQLIRSTLNASMEEKITLEEEVKMIENYLNLEKLRFKEKMEFTIQVDEQLDQYDTMLPPMLTQPFVENALIHGLGKKNTRGKIEIAYRKQMENLEITIRDNGLGIFQTKKLKEKSGSTRKGVGMSISQKRMELVDGFSDFEVKEIKDEHGKIRGTSVRLVLKI